MNFFKLYMGDYQRDTAALTIAQHGAYFLMLQHYYSTEEPLPTGKDLHRMLRAQDKRDRDAIDAVVRKFWTETEEGLINTRADEEIAKANKQAETNARIAREREERRRQKEASDETSTKRATNRQPSQTPDTRHQSSSTTTEPDWRVRIAELQRHAGPGLNQQSFDLERWDFPQAWVEAGCDWQRDVLPTVERLGQRAKPGSIKSWRYFSDAVTEARDKRQGVDVPARGSPAPQTGRHPSELSLEDWLIRIANAERIWPEEYGPEPSKLDGTDEQKARYYLDLHAEKRRAAG